MMRTPGLLGLRGFLAFTAKLWSFLLYLLRRQVRTVSVRRRQGAPYIQPRVQGGGVWEGGSLRGGGVVIDKHPVRFFVHKRPHVDFFLEVVSQWYELVVFTASMEIYGSAVADKLDNNRGVLRRRFYRQHCTLELGSYIKDLSVVHSDLSSVVILDNSPGAYRSHPDNAIPIKSWFSDPSDTALLNLLPMLDALRFTADVRSVLSRNLHQHRLW
ncbi:CTD nuclear envelope phosphatase 1 [Eleutherodactylus coqui]|uniref:CTD nuclear envelope phosphatase 1 n=1 Tax=Eleutherodactylus coqui TaxID=57060 RepID=UPI003461AB7A